MKRQKIKGHRDDGYKSLLGKNSDESGDETELFVRNKPAFSEIQYIEKTVEEGDTLHSLAIRYHCNVADLKRLNNIHKENEIFAKPTIRVPNRPFTAALAAVHTSGRSSPEESPSKKHIDVASLNSKLNETLLNVPSISEPAAEVNTIIFNSHIIPKICDINDLEVSASSSEEVSLLPKCEQVADPVVAKLSCSGADCDIPWIALIVCVVILIFAVPLIYVFYIYEHPQMYHHNYTSLKHVN